MELGEGVGGMAYSVFAQLSDNVQKMIVLEFSDKLDNVRV